MATVAVWDSVLRMIDIKRDEMNLKYGRRFTQMDIASAAIIQGMESVESELGLIKNDSRRE